LKKPLLKFRNRRKFK